MEFCGTISLILSSFQVLRADAVPLVDAWGHSDHCLNSALGRRDGRVQLVGNELFSHPE